MIEQTVLNYLIETLDTNDVYLELPDDLPDSFVVFHVIDRGEVDKIKAVTMEFFSYGKTKLEAAELDEKVREAMDNIIDLPDITCRFGGGNDSPDTTIKRPRYRAYYNIFY